jgi:hypothetical protein
MSELNKSITLKMYKDIKNIITTYFASTSPEELVHYNIDLDSYKDFFDYIKLNYTISHLLELRPIIYMINRQVNRDVNLEQIDVVNGIRGRLDIRRYIKQEYGRVSTKKVFPCVVLKEDYDIIENKFALLVVKYAFEIINKIPITDKNFANEYSKSGHYKLLIKLKRELFEILHSGDLHELHEEISNVKLSDIKSLINRKFIKVVEQKARRKEINRKTYGALLEWWKKINNIEADVFDEMPLLLYSDKFEDKLFELWLLEGIKTVFESKFGLERTHSNPLWKKTKDFIYEFKYEKDNCIKIFKIYLQKSVDVVFSNTESEAPKWRLFNPQTGEGRGYLRGNLDIIITCDDSKDFDPVLIDAKNIFYNITSDENDEQVNKSVTDKVYKMVGYIDNFYKKSSSHKNALGMVIFKNDKMETRLEREYVSDLKDATIDLFSVDPLNNIDFMEEIGLYILNHFALLGTRLKYYNDLKSMFLETIEGIKDNEVMVVYEYITNYTKVLLRGKENEIEDFKKQLEINIFGKTVWGALDNETRSYLAQSELLLSSLSQSTNIEYSMMAINLTKAIENELFEGFIKQFKDYIIGRGIRSHSYFVIDNILKDQHVTLGQVGIMLAGRLDSLIIDYIDNCIINNDMTKRTTATSKMNEIGTLLKAFSGYRNIVAHKDGINRDTFCSIREAVLGIGTSKSILTSIYELNNLL